MDEYAKTRALAKDKKWFRHQGIPVYGAEKRDDGFWTFMRRFYSYDPAIPTSKSATSDSTGFFESLVDWTTTQPRRRTPTRR
jgi:hypothetical protein